MGHDIYDWQNTYFRFKGRFNRARYWLHSVLAFVVAAILQLLCIYMFPVPGEVINVFHSESLQKTIVGIIQIAPAVTFIYISTAISVKRLHDRNKTGWWALFYLGLPSLILLMICRGRQERPYRHLARAPDHSLFHHAACHLRRTRLLQGHRWTQPVRARSRWPPMRPRASWPKPA